MATLSTRTHPISPTTTPQRLTLPRRTLRKFTPGPPNSFIFTFDVPSIPPKIGLEALCNIISPHFSLAKTNLIYTLSAFILEYNFLTFDKKIYQEVKGSAMGNNFSIVYACLFLSH